MTEQQINNNQRIMAIQLRLGEIKGKRGNRERTRLKEELRYLESLSEEIKVGPDSVWETIRKIASMEDALKIMCEDKTVNPQTLMAAGFRGAVRLAKQALKDAGK